MLRRQSTIPLYAQLAEIIKNAILRGSLKVGDLLPPEQELCSTYGVSPGTVKKALDRLQQEGFIGKERGLRTRVVSSIVPEVGGLRGVKTVGFVTRHLLDNLTLEVLAGVERACRMYGYYVFVLNTEDFKEKEVEGLYMLSRIGVRGAVVFPSGDGVESGPLNRLSEEGFPIVMVDYAPPDLEVDSVVSDNVEGGYLGMKYLLELGHRSIGIAYQVRDGIRHDARMNNNSGLRLEGCCRALEALKGEAVNELLPFRLQTACEEEVMSRRGTSRFFFSSAEIAPALRKGHSAIFAMNDLLALDILRTAQQEGLRVPGDFSLLGFDDLAPVSAQLSLTSVRQMKRVMGEKAVELLIERIRGHVGRRQRVVLPVELVRRSTCARLGDKHAIEANAG